MPVVHLYVSNAIAAEGDTLGEGGILVGLVGVTEPATVDTEITTALGRDVFAAPTAADAGTWLSLVIGDGGSYLGTGGHIAIDRVDPAGVLDGSFSVRAAAFDLWTGRPIAGGGTVHVEGRFRARRVEAGEQPTVPTLAPMSGRSAATAAGRRAASGR